jgi:hypothetical protein
VVGTADYHSPVVGSPRTLVIAVAAEASAQVGHPSKAPRMDQAVGASGRRLDVGADLPGEQKGPIKRHDFGRTGHRMELASGLGMGCIRRCSARVGFHWPENGI